MNKTVFVIDCDEVIRPLIQNMVDIYNQYFETDMTYDDVTVIDSNVSFPLLAPNAREWFFQKHGEETYLRRPPIEGATDAIRKLRKYGKVIIATYQPSPQNKIWAVEWFKKYGIEYDDVFFGADKHLLKCDYFIDDDPKYFNNATACHGILMNSSHNQHVKLQDLKRLTNCKTLTRFKSLRQFADYFEKYAKNKN